MVLRHYKQIQGIEGRLKGLYDIARLIIEREVPPPVFIPLWRHGEDPGGDALMCGVSIIMTCQEVAGAEETGITVGGPDIVPSRHVPHYAKKIFPGDPVVHGVYGVALILARGHSLTDVVLLEQVLKPRTCSPIQPRCKAVFLFQSEHCKLGVAGLKIVRALVVAQVPIVMPLQQAMERLGRFC